MLETEMKCMLTHEQYERIRDMFKWDWSKEQVNSYYTDPQMLLKRHGITLRVRTKDNVSKTQVKTHKNANSPLQICEEAEFDTDGVPDGFSEDETERMTGVRTTAYLLGELATLRHSLMYADGVEICLDKSDYLDTTDYEIEVEYTDVFPDKLRKILADNGVLFEENAVGKCTRFMRRLFGIIHGEDGGA